MEDHKDVGAVQGIVLKLGSNKIDSAGGFIDEDLNTHFPFVDKHVEIIRKPIYASFIEGTMPLYRVDAIKRSLKHSKYMYVPSCFFYFLEDVFLSLMLWNNNYKCVILPTITGEHYRGAALKKFSSQVGLPYYSVRNHLALLYMTNSRGKYKRILKILRRLYFSKAGYKRRKLMLNALLDGIRLGRKLKREYGTINIYNVPLLRASLKRKILSWLTL